LNLTNDNVFDALIKAGRTGMQCARGCYVGR